MPTTAPPGSDHPGPFEGELGGGDAVAIRPGDSFTPTPILTPPPPPPDSASAEEKEAWWLTHVYQGDRVPQLTFRAVAVGSLLGMAMSIAHIYTSLKLGWGFGIAITACVISYVLWNAMRALSGGRLSQLTILENTCMQSTASAAGYSTGSTVATAVGAHLLITGEHLPWPALAGFVFFAAALGVFWAIPMKRQMINIERLPFPSGIAAAETLKSLYTEGTEAARKAYALVAALGVGAVVGVLRAPEGALRWLDKVLKTTGLRIPDLIHFEKRFTDRPLPHYVGFGFEPSLLLIGAGMIVGLRVCLSMLGGALLLYFVVGPWLVGMDQAMPGTGWVADAAGLMRYDPTAVDPEVIANVPITAGGNVIHIGRWALWGGTAVMVFASLTSLALQWRTIARSFNVFKRSAPAPAGSVAAAIAAVEVPASWLVAGLIPIGIGMIAVQYFAFGISLWLGLIAVLLSFVISLVCCRATGETDTTPTGAMGKVTQLIFAVLSPGNITHNLMSAGATSSSGLAAADLLTDLKSGYILGANPRKQFWAQFIGIFFGTIITIPGWYLMVPDKAALEAFNPPATSIWAAVAQALTKGLHTIPDTAKSAIVIGAFVGVGVTLLERLFPRGKKYMPSAMGLGFSFVMTFQNSFSFALGALIAWAWARSSKRTHEAYNVPIASGMIAGESLISALIAILATSTKLIWR